MFCVFFWGGEAKVFLGKRKVDFALVVSWVQSFLQEIRLHRGRTLQRETAVWSHIKTCRVWQADVQRVSRRIQKTRGTVTVF